MLNIEKLKTEIHETSGEIRALKKIFRESGQPNLLRRHYYDLKSLKRWASTLCAIKATARGKLHFRNMTLEEQTSFILDDLRTFQIEAAA